MFVAVCRGCGRTFVGQDAWWPHEASCVRLDQGGREPWHGHRNGYQLHKCRCPRCRKAHSDYETARVRAQSTV